MRDQVFREVSNSSPTHGTYRSNSNMNTNFMNEKSVADRFSTAILTNWNDFKQICKTNDMREYIDTVWE